MALRTGIELLEASIQRVWNERDDAKRLAAIQDLYDVNAVIYEPARAITGHDPISAVVRDVLNGMPPGFRFEVVRPSLEHHGMAITRWRGVADGTITVSGSDVLRVTDGLIAEHYFFFDPKV
jgi:hypothetical protein